MNYLAVLYSLTIIGEASNKLSTNFTIKINSETYTKNRIRL